MTRHRTGLLLAAGTAVVSGIAIPFNTLGVKAVGNATLYTTAKNLVAGLLLVAIAIAVATHRASGPKPGADVEKPADPREMPPLPRWRGVAAGVVLAVLGGAVPFVMFFEGLARATSADANFLHKTLVVWVAILAVVFLRERIRVLHVLAIALLVAGQAALVGHLPSVTLGSGELLVLGATALWSIEIVVAKRFLAWMAPSTAGAWRIAGGSVLLVAWSAAQRADLGALSGDAWMWIGVSGVLLTTYVATWFAALARAPAIDVTAVLTLGALVSSVIAVARGLQPVGAVAPGSLLLVAGALALLAGSRRTVEPVAPADDVVRSR